MKILLLTFLLSVSFSLFAQKNIIGRYRDYFGSRVEIKSDSTFKYTWRFDLSYSWTKGNWSLKNDTVYFHMIPTYDTIVYNNNDGTTTNKLILSDDEIPDRMTAKQHVAYGLSSGGQNTHGHPEKLFFKKGRLYKILNGKLITKKHKGIGGIGKKWKPWFFRSDD